MDIVYARATCTVTAPSGVRVVIREGEAWAADDPLVRSRPALFTTETATPRRTVVEQATAAPGEKRRRG